jgi:hypothetical protein
LLGAEVSSSRQELPVPLEKQRFQRHYVLAAAAGETSFYSVAARLRAQPEWNVTEPTGQDMMVTMPRELTDFLLALA